MHLFIPPTGLAHCPGAELAALWGVPSRQARLRLHLHCLHFIHCTAWVCERSVLPLLPQMAPAFKGPNGQCALECKSMGQSSIYLGFITPSITPSINVAIM